MKEIHKCIKNEKIDIAIAMLSWLIMFMGRIYVDDSSSGCMGYYFDEVNEICEELLNMNEETKKKIVNELNKLKKEVSLHFIEEEFFNK